MCGFHTGLSNLHLQKQVGSNSTALGFEPVAQIERRSATPARLKKKKQKKNPAKSQTAKCFSKSCFLKDLNKNVNSLSKQYSQFQYNGLVSITY